MGCTVSDPRQVRIASPWVIANSEIRVGQLHRLFPLPRSGSLCRGAHVHARVHLIAHATIVPSPYQDSLRRDGGQARWDFGNWVRDIIVVSVRFRKCQVAFPWARTSTRIQGVVYSSTGSVVIPNSS